MRKKRGKRETKKRKTKQDPHSSSKKTIINKPKQNDLTIGPKHETRKTTLRNCIARLGDKLWGSFTSKTPLELKCIRTDTIPSKKHPREKRRNKRPKERTPSR